MAMATKNDSKKSKSTGQEKDASFTRVPADTLPRRSLEQALPFATALHEHYAGKSATVEEIATALEISPKSSALKPLTGAALAYGIVVRAENGAIGLAETGRKIVAPTYDGEDRDARVKAVLTPALLSKFYSDYNGYPIPGDTHFPNVLETKYGVPRDRVEEAIRIILENARYAGVLEESSSGGQPLIRLTGVATVKPSTPPAQVIVGTPAAVEEQPEAPGAGDAEWDSVCFFITPIGEDGSEVRKHSDMMLKHLLEPVAKEFNLKVVRADRIDRAGLITQQIFEHLVRSKLCVADLSFGNPNAFYELGVRHVCKLPSVQIIRKGDKIPFDVAQGRTIVVDTSDIYTIMDRVESARRELAEHVRHIVSGDTAAIEGNPVEVYLPALRVTIPR